MLRALLQSRIRQTQTQVETSLFGYSVGFVLGHVALSGRVVVVGIEGDVAVAVGQVLYVVAAVCSL